MNDLNIYLNTMNELAKDSVKNNNIKKEFKNTFFSELNIDKLPILQHTPRFIGRTGTDYIDNIGLEDCDNPIMISKDHYNRLYLVLKYTCYDDYFLIDIRDHEVKYYDINSTRVIKINNKYYLKKYIGKDTEKLLVIFQRFTDSAEEWCKAGDCGMRDPILSCSPVLLRDCDKEHLIKNIKELLNNEAISLIDNNKCDCRLIRG